MKIDCNQQHTATDEYVNHLYMDNHNNTTYDTRNSFEMTQTMQPLINIGECDTNVNEMSNHCRNNTNSTTDKL